MQTECITDRFDFQPLEKRELRGIFDGGAITSDAGGLLLREVEAKLAIISRFAACFTDHRDPQPIEHSVYQLVAQRVYGLALGYEDLNDHDELRHDPLMAVLVGKQDPTGQDRVRRRDRGKALAGRSRLNRLELSPPGADAKSRYKKITANLGRMESLFTDFFIEAHPTPPERIILDFDATDDPIHGDQLGRFFQGYYKAYCYLPLDVFCGEHLLCAQLRPADNDDYEGRSLYEELYSGRGEMENRIKQQQLMLFADRTSAEDMRANQIRLYLSSIAYVVVSAMRRIGLADTPIERAHCSTIRLKLLKIGALVRIAVRKIWVSFSQSYPYRKQFLRILEKIRRWQPVVLRC